MKSRYYLIAAAVVLVLAVIVIAKRSGKPAAPSTPDKAASPAAQPQPRPEQVRAVVLSRPGGAELARMTRAGDGWKLDSLGGIPADKEKAERFVRDLLSAAREPSTEKPEQAGLGSGAGVAVDLESEAGTSFPGVIVGKRPEGKADSVYVMPKGGGGVSLLRADLGSQMGMPGNTPDAAAGMGWLPSRALAFQPDAAVGLVATYPDNRLALVRGDNGEWRLEEPPPAAGWDQKAAVAWLADLSDFHADAKTMDKSAGHGLDKPDFALAIAMKDGSAKNLTATADRSGSGVWVETSDQPGVARLLALADFGKYFEREAQLFPDAIPSFKAEDVRLADLRRDGEGVKFARADGGWRATAMPYPARREGVDALVKRLAEWRPAAFASADFPAARPVFGSPLVDVLLADNTIVQYRLGGTHPVLPRRYVMVNGTHAFSVADAEAAALFPDFGDVLDLGKILAGVNPADVAGLIMTDAAGNKVFSLSKKGDGAWEAATAAGSAALDAAEAGKLAGAPADWNAAGLFTRGPDAFANVPGRFRFAIATPSGGHTLDILPEQNGVFPVLRDEKAAFTVSGNDIRNWLTAMSAANSRIRQEKGNAPLRPTP